MFKNSVYQELFWFLDENNLLPTSALTGPKKVKVKSSMAKSLTVENLLPHNVGSIINYLQ